MELSVSKVLLKLDMNAAPGPSGLRIGHIRIWAGIFAPPNADEAIRWLEMLLTDITNDMLSSWFMQAIGAAELMALVKAEAKLTGGVAGHIPVHVRNTLAKVGDKVVLEQF